MSNFITNGLLLTKNINQDCFHDYPWVNYPWSMEYKSFNPQVNLLSNKEIKQYQGNHHNQNIYPWVFKSLDPSSTAITNDDLKEFLVHGVTKSYNIHQINDQSIMLPNEISQQFISHYEENSILKAINVLYTDSNSMVIPLRKSKKNPCLWHEYGKSPDHNNEDCLDHKLINLNGLSTCPIVSRDFLFKNDNLVSWLMDWIHNDIYNEVCQNILSPDPKSPSVKSILDVPENRLLKIKYEPKKQNIIESLKTAMYKVSGIYRKNSKFIMSGKFFDKLLHELLDFNHPLSTLIVNDNKIFGYDYEIMEQIHEDYCVFGDLRSAYTLIIKNDNHLERDGVTKKNFVQFFWVNSFGGSLVNGEALMVIKNEE
jgi:HK97 family phage major capsid protein